MLNQSVAKMAFQKRDFSLKKIRRKNADVLDVNINSKNALTIVFQIRLHFLFFSGCCIRADGLMKKIERLRKSIDFPPCGKPPLRMVCAGAHSRCRSLSNTTVTIDRSGH